MPSGNQAGFCGEWGSGVDGAVVRAWFADPVAVRHYVRAAVSVGLWASEARVFSAVFCRDERILDLGCGAGRIALGLWRLGFRRIEGIDYAPAMIDAARDIAADVGADIPFAVGDATRLELPAGSFGGAIFGFNGLMQIPGRANRRRALENIGRAVAAGGKLVFTTHDRELPGARLAWDREAPEAGEAAPRGAPGFEFGDRVGELPEGRIFMHWPSREEILDDLRATGWTHLEDHLRSRIANESGTVRAFSDECRFWICANTARPGD